MAKSKITWKEDMAFNVELDGHNFAIDATAKVGEKNSGPSPKGLLLSALGGCTGMDIVSILKKMKIENYKLEIEVEADQTDEHPIIYKDIVIIYNFHGEDLSISKLKRAVELSETTYCGVSAMLGKAAKISNQIKVNGELVS